MAMADIFLSVSTSLNDQEPGFQYLRWPVVELTGYFNEALLEVFTYRKDAFTSTVAINNLAAQSQQTLNGLTINGVPVSFLKSVDYNSPNGPCGAAPIVECDLALMRTFYKAPCGFTGGPTVYRVLSYAYDAKNPNVFYISPPPPSNGFGIVISAIAPPPTYVQTGGGNSLTWSPIDITDNPLIHEYTDAFKFWMLARANEVDTESNTSQAESEKFYKKFYNILGINYKQTSGYNAGKYLEQGSDHNMTKQRVP